ncbi:MAG: SGNH/GDSL hydrolase family protein [Janthinobacterium lividum]
MSTYRFVALGDSFTEGMVDVGLDGEYRGWADRLAGHLSRTFATEGITLDYANLAVRGRLMSEIAADQLPRALDLHPDLVSFVAGGNDLLRPGADPDALAVTLEESVVALSAAGVRVLLATGCDRGRTPLLRYHRSAVAILNSHVWGIAARHGCLVLDLWNIPELRARRSWDEDRIHLSPEGHEQVAVTALRVLGHPRPENAPDAREPLPVQSATPRLATNLHWTRTYLLPWVGRRLRRTSSGAGRVAKRPEPLPLD